jgi:hypothetical protein
LKYKRAVAKLFAGVEAEFWFAARVWRFGAAADPTKGATRMISVKIAALIAIPVAAAVAVAGSHLHGRSCPGAQLLAWSGLAACTATDNTEQDSKNAVSLKGAWVLQGAEAKIEFAEKDVMKIYPHGESDVIVVVCKYTADKKGAVKATITELQGKGKEKAQALVPVGLEFSFTWGVKDNIATLAEVTGTNTDALKSHLEGKYLPKN